MAKLSIKPGSTDVTLLVFCQDSTSTTGAGKTGLAYNTASLTCYYARPGAAAAALSLVTQTVTGAHSDGGFVEVDATNLPGVYRLDLSDAIVAAGVRSAVVMLKGATGLAPLPLEIDLNAEVNTTHVGGTAQTGRDLGASVLLSSGTGTGQISLSSGAVLLQATQTGVTIPTVTAVTTVNGLAAGVITAAAVATGAIDADALAADAGTEIGTAVWATATRTLTASSDPTAAAIADAVWDEMRVDHTDAGSFGDIDTTGDIADAVWNEARTDHVAAGSFGEGAASVQGNVTGSVGSVTGAVGSVTGAVGSVTGNVGGNVTGSVGSLATQAKADVNAEVVDALATDTYAEPSAVPAATATLAAKLGWVTALSRNKVTQSATTQTLRNDADGADVATAAVSDSGTVFTRGEWT